MKKDHKRDLFDKQILNKIFNYIDFNFDKHSQEELIENVLPDIFNKLKGKDKNQLWDQYKMLAETRYLNLIKEAENNELVRQWD